MTEDYVWSYSALSCYETCPSQFYRSYIQGEKGEENGFASCGSAAHKVLEELEKGTLRYQDARERFLQLWDEAGRPGTQKNADACSAYFGNLTGWELQGYKVLEAEGYHHFTIGSHRFIGGVDLLLQDERGGLILVDHKSHKHLLKQDGSVLRGEEKTFEAYKRQAYLYCEMIRQIYGQYPERIIWNHFQDCGKQTVIPFKMWEMQDAINWAIKIIVNITTDKLFLTRTDKFFCWKLCGFRNSCEAARQMKAKKAG